LPLPDISSVFQYIDQINYITVADCNKGNLMWNEYKWLTAFICDAGLFEFNRAPFSLKCSVNSFIWAISKILHTVRDFTNSFVDDVAVHSDIC